MKEVEGDKEEEGEQVNIKKWMKLNFRKIQ